MKILTFVLQNLDAILTLLAVVAVVVLAVVYVRKNGVAFIDAMLLGLVTEAEKDFGGGTGILKKSTVVTAIYEKLPSILRLFISEATVSRLIDEAVESAKIKWASNDRLNEIISGNTVDKAMVDTVTAELKAIVERITSDEGKSVTLDLMRSVLAMCGIDATHITTKAEAVTALKGYLGVA